MVFGDSWQFLVVIGSSQWFLVFMVVLGGSWAFLVVLEGS